MTDVACPYCRMVGEHACNCWAPTVAPPPVERGVGEYTIKEPPWPEHSSDPLPPSSDVGELVERLSIGGCDRLSTEIQKDLDLHIEAIPLICKHIFPLAEDAAAMLQAQAAEIERLYDNNGWCANHIGGLEAKIAALTEKLEEAARVADRMEPDKCCGGIGDAIRRLHTNEGG